MDPGKNNMKNYIESRNGWWRSSKRVLLVVGLIMIPFLTLIFMASVYFIEFILLQHSDPFVDFGWASIFIFIFFLTIIPIWLIKTSMEEHWIMFIGSEDRFEKIVTSLENSLKDSNIQYDPLDLSTKEITQLFKLPELESSLYITKNIRENERFPISIKIMPVNRKNKDKIHLIKSAIEEIMNENGYDVYRESEDLIQIS
jgi:hypothetical protein